MNKPLTIEQLKSLEVGDWVWVVVKENAYPNSAQETGYCMIGQSKDGIGCGYMCKVLYTDYGKTWLAYKNKEQAEGEYDSRVEQAKKQVAKEILDSIYCVVNRFLDDDTLEYIFDSQYKKYGVEIDE